MTHFNTIPVTVPGQAPAALPLPALLEPPLEPNWPVNLSVIGTRLAFAGVIWVLTLLAVDDPRIGQQDMRVFNLRMGLWIFMAELLIDLYRTAYATPSGFAGTRWLAIRESARHALATLWMAPVSLLIRWTLIVLATAALLCLPAQVAWTAYLAPCVPTIGIRLVRRWLAKRTNKPVHPLIRGMHIGSYVEAVARAAAWGLHARARLLQDLTSAADPAAPPVTAVDLAVPKVPWGGVELPLELMDPNYLLLGVAGSGKTLAIRMLMQSVLAPQPGNLAARALVYDAKREFYPLLLGMGVPQDSIIILNPADTRSTAWDIAADVQTDDDARNIAKALVPDANRQGQEHVFFVEAVQSILGAVMEVLHRRSRGRWTLNNVLNACATPETLKAFVQGDPEGMNTYQRYFTNAPETVGGIISTIDTKLITPYKTTARLWERAARRVSLRAWVSDARPLVLLLGTDENSAAVDRINQAMFRRIAQLVEAKAEDPHDPDHHRDTTWFFLDELRFAGELPMLGKVVTFGRSKGVRAVLATQDIDGLYAEYGEHKGNELLALCGNVSVFRLTSPKTREWASKFFGEYEAWEADYSFGVSSSRTRTTNWATVSKTRGNSESRTTHQRIVKREAVLPSEFFNMPKAGPDNGISGLSATAAMGAWRGPVPWSFVKDRLQPKELHAPGFIPRPPPDYDPVAPPAPVAATPPPPPAPAPPTPDLFNPAPDTAPAQPRRGRLPQ